MTLNTLWHQKNRTRWNYFINNEFMKLMFCLLLIRVNPTKSTVLTLLFEFFNKTFHCLINFLKIIINFICCSSLRSEVAFCRDIQSHGQSPIPGIKIPKLRKSRISRVKIPWLKNKSRPRDFFNFRDFSLGIFSEFFRNFHIQIPIPRIVDFRNFRLGIFGFRYFRDFLI